MPTPAAGKFLFISSNGTPWGGSEELWAAAAIAVAGQGHQVTVLKPNVNLAHPRVERLRELGARVRDLSRMAFVPRRLYQFAVSTSHAIAVAHRVASVARALALSKYDLVVISQGGNLDGVQIANVCRRMKRPYVLISQKAGDMYWPADARRERMRAVYSEALECYFVSEHNRRLTEEQIGVHLPNAAVVRNPFLVPWARRTDWPDQTNGLRLACVGRFYPAEKGQDLLIRVLARDKWRERPLSVTLFGKGSNQTGLEQMAAFHGVTSISFGGFTANVAEIWNDHHGLILPSRCEGLPLVLVEAMLCGRVPIVTDVAGNGEVMRDNVTGFLAAAPTEDSLDEALERAWQRRADLQAIGNAAADAIRTLVPPDPGQVLGDRLIKVAAVENVTAAAG
jgi:glycosyltransferase involved in cell wall biosynthesis